MTFCALSNVVSGALLRTKQEVSHTSEVTIPSHIYCRLAPRNMAIGQRFSIRTRPDITCLLHCLSSGPTESARRSHPRTPHWFKGISSLLFIKLDIMVISLRGISLGCDHRWDSHTELPSKIGSNDQKSLPEIGHCSDVAMCRALG